MRLTGGADSGDETPRRQKFFKKPRFELDTETREAMRRETEMFVSSIVHDDRPVTELIDSDYTFLNEKLAKLYGITNVTGARCSGWICPPAVCAAAC
jgi:hypothetical protein